MNGYFRPLKADWIFFKMLESLLIAVGVVLTLSGLMWAYNLLIRPPNKSSWLEKMLTKIRASDYVPPPKQSDFEMSFNAVGITVAEKRPISAPIQFIAWTDIVREVAFKRDLFTVDCICLGFDTVDGMTTELNEEMNGWEALTDALPKYLPGCKVWSECFSQVAFPAFATNETVIFEKKSVVSNCNSV